MKNNNNKAHAIVNNSNNVSNGKIQKAKSYSVQKRILRCIVEKRQAQKTHRKVGRTENRFTNIYSVTYTSKSINE